jgi:hypothetical protein
MIHEMCRQRFAGHTAEEVEVRVMAPARQNTEEEEAAFEREGEVADEAMEELMENAADVAVGKMHAAAAR